MLRVTVFCIHQGVHCVFRGMQGFIKHTAFFVQLVNTVNYCRIEKNEMGGGACAYGGGERCAQGSGGET